MVSPARVAVFTVTRKLACLTLGASGALALWIALGRNVPAGSLPPGFAGAYLILTVGVEPLAVPFLVSIAIVAPAVALWCARRGAAPDGFRLTAFVAAMIAVLVAQSIAAFFLAWEAMALVSAFLVGTHHERRDVQRALLSYILVGQVGALAILTALAILGAHAGSGGFAEIAHASRTLSPVLRDAVVALALIGFGSKAGLVPLHFWLPRAHPVAPANASALLSGVMLNVAAYGFLAVCFTFANPVALGWSVGIAAVGAVTAFAGALYAAIESDFKRLLAFSSIENLGIVVTAIGFALVAGAIGRPFWAHLALVAAVFHALGHGAFKSLLFLGAGTVAEEAHTTDLEALGGLARRLRISAPLVLVGVCAAASLPPLTGFASEWLVVRSAIGTIGAADPGLRIVLGAAVALLAAASGLAALAFVKLFGIAFLGEPRTARTIGRERFDASGAGLAWLALVCVAAGCAPGLVLAALGAVLGRVDGAGPLVLPSFATLPAALVALPFAGACAAVATARARGVRRAPPWTCGSVVTSRSQESAVAFSKPIRRIFAFVLAPEHRRRSDGGTSSWFPLRVRYDMIAHDRIDEFARTIAAVVQRFARGARIVQAGWLRVYLAYAVVAVLALLAVAR